MAITVSDGSRRRHGKASLPQLATMAMTIGRVPMSIVGNGASASWIAAAKKR